MEGLVFVLEAEVVEQIMVEIEEMDGEEVNKEVYDARKD